MSSWLRVALFLCCVLEVVVAQGGCEQPNVAVIVVASVFGTLAVVFITLGIICFLLWKRRRALSRPLSTPEKNNLKDHDLGARNGDGGFANPAFSETDGQGDPSLAEEGIGGYVRCREYTPEKKSVKEHDKKDPSKKTWTSFPRGDLPPGPAHNGSLGSLDDHYISADPEVSSVWLQSQDFIGLGFNIAGSMRDGIYVSQVHNRGPAVESGKFKIGDRILSVTISFENMVYEDALTILSYASPYPVKVTLQKELTATKNRKQSDAYANLSHPLYRSQSLDTISKIGKDTNFIPKRSLSVASQGILEDRLQMSPLLANFSLEKESTIRESQESFSSPTRVDTQPFQTSTQVEINTPPAEIISSADEVFSPVKVETNESAPPVPTLPPPAEFGEEEEDESKPPPEPSVPPPPLDFDSTDGTTESKETSGISAEYTALFDSLNEQDKLDMLRLSYEDPDTSFNYSQNSLSIDTTGTEGESSTNTVIDVQPKTPPPIKPERRKKKSSSGSMSSPEPSPRIPDNQLPTPDDINDDVVVPVSMEFVHSAPKADDEINEEVILPQKKSRDISILSKNIEFSAVESSNMSPRFDVEDSPRNASKTLVDYSLSDMESTMRPQTPENHTVEEEMITPVQNKRGALESSMKLFSNSDISLTPTSSDPYNAKVKDSIGDASDSDKNDSKEENTTIESVDFNLNMTSNPNLFSTPYPRRNEKETASGLSYDISMMELNDIENKMKKEPKETGKGGISFEIRDDVVSGGTVLTSVSKPKTVYQDTTHVTRTRSYQDNVGTAHKVKLERPDSLDPDHSLEWSGKRLVRSGSFPEIPQDAEKDWTDHNRIDDEEDENNEEGESFMVDDDLNSSEESLEQSEKKGLTKTPLFRARENLADLSSENSTSLPSINSSSRSSTPPPPYSANGNEDNGLGTSPETTPIKTPLNINALSTTSDLIEVIPTNTSINADVNSNDNNPVTPRVEGNSNFTRVEGNSNFTVTVDSSHDNEADC